MSNKQNHLTNSNQTSVAQSNVQSSPAAAANTMNNAPVPPAALTNLPSWLVNIIEVANKIDATVLNQKIEQIDINKVIEHILGKVPTTVANLTVQQPSQQSSEPTGDQSDVRVIKKDGAVTIHLNNESAWVKEFDYTDAKAWSEVGIDISTLLTYVNNDVSKINIIEQ
jgi:hypothetical protein